ncbi:MAG: DUF2064 domain-containing protein [Rhizobiales bacterium]|nr:DUF2064 domain-containing protein [Hyphomicrobiales bacterium]
MAKLPRVGRVKTRLGRAIGRGRATQLYRHMVAGLVARIGRDPRFRVVLAVSPDNALADRFWPCHLARTAQGAGDLGVRMQRLLERALAGEEAGRPGGATILIGTDLPAVDAPVLATAFARLKGADAVLGPAEDGGFWLVGWRGGRAMPDLFEGVTWSVSSTLAETKANLEGRRVAHAATLGDLDTRADLDRLGRLIGRRVLPAAGRGGASVPPRPIGVI